MTRTPAEAIAAVQRHGPAISPETRAAALELLRDMLAAAAQHGVGLGDFDDVLDIAGGCIDVIVAKQRNA